MSKASRNRQDKQRKEQYDWEHSTFMFDWKKFEEKYPHLPKGMTNVNLYDQDLGNKFITAIEEFINTETNGRGLPRNVCCLDDNGNITDFIKAV